MDQSPNPPYAVPPPFSPPPSAHRSSADSQQRASVDIDMMAKSSDDRSTRAGSVLSGMSIEDMEAAETLKGLSQSKRLVACSHGRFHTDMR
jgi:hypothetical protein